MEKLEIVPDKYRLVRYVHIERRKDESIAFQGVDATGIPYTFLKNAIQTNGENKAKQEKEPYIFKLPKGSTTYNLELEFYKHYNEPNLKVVVDLKDLKE